MDAAKRGTELLCFGHKVFLKQSIIQRLSVFERKTLRKIFGPTKEDNGTWRNKKTRGWMS